MPSRLVLPPAVSTMNSMVVPPSMSSGTKRQFSYAMVIFPS